MDNVPELKSERLRIVPFSERHLHERYVTWLNDPDLMRFSEQRHKVHTLDSCRAYWCSFLGTPHYFWAIEEVVDGLGHIGNINAYVDISNQIADLGIVIGEATARGRGYGVEAWRTTCSYFFEQARMRKISAGTMATNGAMLRLMRTAGMVEDGIRRKHYLCEGKETDVVHMAMFDSINSISRDLKGQKYETR